VRASDARGRRREDDDDDDDDDAGETNESDGDPPRVRTILDLDVRAVARCGTREGRERRRTW